MIFLKRVLNSCRKKAIISKLMSKTYMIMIARIFSNVSKKWELKLIYDLIFVSQYMSYYITFMLFIINLFIIIYMVIAKFTIFELLS